VYGGVAALVLSLVSLTLSLLLSLVMFVYHVNSHLLSEQQLISYYLICLFHFYGTCESGLTYFRYLLYLLYIKRDVVFLSISSTCAC